MIFSVRPCWPSLGAEYLPLVAASTTVCLMEGLSAWVQAAQKEPCATPLGNFAHMDNNLLPNHSNTKTGQAETGVASEPELVAQPLWEVADLLP